jgi:hypothetical protein
MRTYAVLESPEGNVEIVKRGLCWPCFFIGVFWPMLLGMWKVVLYCIFIPIGISIFLFLVVFVIGKGGEETVILISFLPSVVSIVLFINCNELEEKYWVSKGFKLAETIEVKYYEFAKKHAISRSRELKSQVAASDPLS